MIGARTTLAVFLLLSPSRGWGESEVNDERLLTVAEVAGLERENRLWRLVRPEEEVAENLERMRRAGFTAEEMTALQPRLAAMWDVPVERNFGWLHEDTVRQIQEIDRRFIARTRALRLYEATGIRTGGLTPGTADGLNRLWRGAVLKVLDYDEIAEFRLMNSAAAREVGRLVNGLKLSDDELRTLFEWQREFAGTHGAALPAFSRPSAWRREDQLDQWRRIRELLGDERFITYLDRASPGFDRMHQALARAGGVTPTVALDLWWLRQKDGRMRDEEPLRRKKDELTARMRAKVVGLLGEPLAAKYLQDQDGRWLAVPAIRVRRREDRPAPANP